MTQIGLNDLNQFIAGTPAVASQVNENFTVIKAAHNDTDSNVTAIQTTLQDVIMADGSKDFTRLQSYKLHTITNATNATPIVITSALHEFLTGDTVQISGIEGNAAANGTFTITKVDNNSFSLDDSVGGGNYSSGGVALIVPTANENLVNLACMNAEITEKTNKQVVFDSLGTVSENITLTENKITTGYFSGSTTITLPSTTDNEKQVECYLDFTTASTGYPHINQYKALTGTIAVTNADATVTGTDTEFTTEIKAKDKILIANVEYTVLAVISDTELELTATYAGTTASGLSTSRKFVRWSSFNKGKAPSVYSTIDGVRNRLTFKSIWEGGLPYWETKYDTFGGTLVSVSAPVLSSNGTPGVSSFALVAVSAYASASTAYYTFTTGGSYWGLQTNGDYIEFITTEPYLYKFISWDCAQYPNANITITGSNDGQLYTPIPFTLPNLSNNYQAIDMSNNETFYTHFRITKLGGSYVYWGAGTMFTFGNVQKIQV